MLDQAVTQGILVGVDASYVPAQSDPSASRYFFSYRVTIRNDSPNAVRLLSRHWIITDGRGRVEEVHGAGVLGQQPRLEPGASFEYESFCPMTTPTGIMRGAYTMQTDGGQRLEVAIPQFFLAEPSSFH